jgi:hypothetical protein
MLLTHGMMKGECPINGLGVLLSFLEQIILEGKCSLERPPAKAFIKPFFIPGFIGMGVPPHFLKEPLLMFPWIFYILV